MRETSGSQDFNAVFLRMLAGVGRRHGIFQYVESLLAAFVTPVFMTLLFVLRLKGPRFSDHPALAAWYARMGARPAVARAAAEIAAEDRRLSPPIDG